MINPVAQTAQTRKRSALDYTSRELRLMFAASNALLQGHCSGLSASELEEAEQLLTGLDTDEADHTIAPTDDPEAHDPGCGCWLHDDEYAYHDEADMAHEMAAVRRVA